MDGPQPKSGLIVSGAMHAGLLALLVFGLTRAPRFDDASESIPVETITTTQLNEIMEGERTAKPAPKPAEAAPAPAPPPPEPPQPPPPEPPKPPPPAPPPPPEPPKPPPPAPEPPTPPPPAPEPPKRPEPPKAVAEEAPSQPARVKPPKPEDTPKPPERPRKVEEAKPDKFKPDEIAKTLAKPEEKPRRAAPAYDPNAIAKLIGQKTADARPDAQPVQGLANRHAQRMSVSLENALNEWLIDSYNNCWTLPPTNPAGDNYVFDVRVTFNADGSLAARPVMLNPPHSPEWQAHADSVMRAVMRCNPLRVPSQYQPYFDQWRTKVVHFDPARAGG